MTGLRARCVWVVMAPLAMTGAALSLLSSFAGVADTVPVLLAGLVVAALAGLAAFVLSAPLSRDLDAVRVLGDSFGATRPAASAETAEGAALLEHLGRLLKRADALAAEQAEARRAIETAERLRTSFVAAMGHDLKNPLNAIVGFADLLEMDGASVAGSQRDSLALIRRAAHDLLALLDQILLWARLEAGRLSLSPQPVAIRPLLEQVARVATERSAERGLRVELRCPDDLPPASADAPRMVEALLCLMDHAVRSADPGRIEIVAAAEPPGTHLTIHDRGLEVREADIGHFFEPFRPSHAPSGRRIAGMGIGPALGRALIRAHGGDVWFESRREIGTRFHVTLP